MSITLNKQKLLAALIIFSCCVGYNSTVSAKAKSLAILEKMPNASLAIEGDPLHSLRVDKPMTPASTLKVFTALLAFKTWSPQHRFETVFYLDKNNVLWVKGFGDPFLTSQELNKIASALKKKGLKQLNGISVDNHYFAADISIDGKTHTLNPYDAPVSALALNFNTLSVIRRDSKVYSGEKQTPLTPLAQKIADGLPNGYFRINIGDTQEHTSRYFAEVLQAKLKQQGIKVADFIGKGHVSADEKPFYRHKNSHTLTQIVSEMLEHSNNFIANQLFLMMGAQRYGAPANIYKSQQAAAEKVRNLFGWKQQIFYEGSGLSLKNQLSANQFIRVLQKFSPYKTLLKPQGKNILAKTGTLTGVSSYAGYLRKAKKWTPFALFINQPVQNGFRKQVAQELLSLKK
jgi:D-alanyl-D-alanine carboxypeptidase/D-alanyl-D-alanine-endopeptidase (penicillin-binding protein 4)